jgi:hypothetical protein
MDILTITNESQDFKDFNNIIKDINNKNELYNYINGATTYMLCHKYRYDDILIKRMNIIIKYYINQFNYDELYDERNMLKLYDYYYNNVIDNFKNITIEEYYKMYNDSLKNTEEDRDDDNCSVDLDLITHYKSKFPTQEMLKEYYEKLHKYKNYYTDKDNDYYINDNDKDNISDCDSCVSYEDEIYNVEDIIDDENIEYYSDDDY